MKKIIIVIISLLFIMPIFPVTVKADEIETPVEEPVIIMLSSVKCFLRIIR